MRKILEKVIHLEQIKEIIRKLILEGSMANLIAKLLMFPSKVKAKVYVQILF